MGAALTLAIAAVLLAVVMTALLGMRREVVRSLDAMEEWRGRLRKGRRLYPEQIHPLFAKRQRGVPTLVAFVSSSCSYCEQGLRAVCDAIPQDRAAICVAYAQGGGVPLWLKGPLGDRVLAAPVESEWFTRLHVKIVPHWIWLTPTDTVSSDFIGFAGDVSLRLILSGVA